MNARQLDWGYVAHPPLTPLLARIELVLLGSSLIWIRLLPARPWPDGIYHPLRH